MGYCVHGVHVGVCVMFCMSVYVHFHLCTLYILCGYERVLNICICMSICVLIWSDMWSRVGISTFEYVLCFCVCIMCVHAGVIRVCTCVCNHLVIYSLPTDYTTLYLTPCIRTLLLVIKNVSSFNVHNLIGILRYWEQQMSSLCTNGISVNICSTDSFKFIINALVYTGVQ